MSQVALAKQATRAFNGNNYEYTDLTSNLMIIPNIWNLGEALGIFGTDTTNQETMTLEEIKTGFGVINDQHRGQRHQVIHDPNRRMHAFAMPHFNLDASITPRDIQGKRAFGVDALETLAAVRARKLETIRRSWAATHEKAIWHTVVTGTNYAPQGTCQYDWYTQFEQTRKVVDFEFTNASTDIMVPSEVIFAHIQDNSQDGMVRDDVLAVCSPEFFAALIAHPSVKGLYMAYQQAGLNPLKDRLRAAGYDARFRDFTFGNIHYLEYRGVGPDGQRYIPANEAYFIPTGLGEDFVQVFGPADHFDYINTQGQELYAFEYGDHRGQLIEIATESNFIHVMRRPQLIVRGTMS